MEDNNNADALVDGAHVTPPAADATVSSVPADGMTLSEINEALGKNFPSKEAALKSFKDTFSYVGKKIEDVKREVLSDVKNDDRLDKLAKELAEERKERFYLQNPQYTSVRKVIEKFGGSPAEVVNSDEFKEVYTKISGYDESQKLRTVLESNPRLSSSRDSLTKAREVAKTTGGYANDEVQQNVVNAVKDAFGL